MKSAFAALSFVFIFALAGPSFGQSSPTYGVTKSIHLGGPGRWDYVDVGPDHLLYLTRSSHEQIIDPATGKVVADMKMGEGLHGTAVVPECNRGFVTDGKGGTLVVFDLATHAVLGTIPAANDADGIIYDPGTKRLLVACGDSDKLLILDPAADLKTAKCDSVDLGSAPEFLAADGNGHAYVCMNEKSEIAVVDLHDLKVTQRWPIGGGTEPAGLAIDAKAGRLFVGCHNEKMVVLDTAGGHVLAELPIGHGNDACAFDPGTKLAFASCGDGTLTVIGESAPGTFAVVQTVKTAVGARTVGLDATSHTLYLPTAERGPTTQGDRWPQMLPDTFRVVVVSAKTDVPPTK